MSVQACVGTVITPAGTGAQVVTDITDASGASFTPQVVAFFSVAQGLGFHTYEYVLTGLDDATTHIGTAVGARPYALAGLNERGGFLSRTTYSIIYLSEGISAATIREGYISAMGVGQFTIQYDQNSAGAGDLYFFLALGGSSLQYALGRFPTLAAGGSYSVTGLPFTPTCELFMYLSAATTATSSWDGQPGMGWAVSPSQQGCLSIYDRAVDTPSSTKRYQRSDQCGAHFTPGGTGDAGTIAGTISLASQDAAGFTVSGPADSATGGGQAWAYLALNCGAQAGTLTQPGTTGLQTIVTTGLQPVAALFLSANAVSSATVGTGASCSMGLTDGTRQASCWTGDANGINPDNPSGYNDGSSCLSLATPPSTVNAQAAIRTFAGQHVQINWGTVDSTAREVLYLVLATAYTPPPPPTPTIRAIRRVRTFPLPYGTNLWLYLSRLEIILQQGMGLISGQGAMPILMCRISRDGGMTFGPELQMGAGAIGQFQNRSYLNRLGRARNFVVELTCTDPIPWYLLDAIVDLDQGTS